MQSVFIRVLMDEWQMRIELEPKPELIDDVHHHPAAPPQVLRATSRRDPWYVRWGLTTLAILVLTVLVIIPVINVFYNALAAGVHRYFENLFLYPDTRHSILLTLAVAPTAVLCNLIFGVTAAWAIARFRFPFRTTLITLIDLPFSISPVVAGLLFVLIFGQQGYLGPWLKDHGISILFSPPALVIATTFVTLPFVARELIPVMEAIGPEEELAAISLGARAWQVWWKITLPNIRWGLLYGVILCNARAMGEFGAVSVLSGHISGQTDTMPLRVEKAFQEFNLPGSFAVASVLTMLAVATLLLKVTIERKARKQMDEARDSVKSH
jgi:sulfate transport system permease protein